MRSALLLLPLLTACQTLTGSGAAGDPSAPPTTVVDAHPSEVTPLAVGQVLRIVLQSNPSTGYRWDLATPLPAQVLPEPGNTLPQPPSPVDTAHPRGGAPQEQWVYLRAVSPGQAVVQLHWHRPWEQDQPPARTARYAINVR